MKIALDLRRIGNPGIGRYMRCLTEALLTIAPENEYLLIVPPGGVGAIQSCSSNVQKIACQAKSYSIGEQLAIPRILLRHKVDVLHAPHFNIPLFCPCSCVVTIHDIIYLACSNELPSRMGRLYYRGMMNAAVRLAGQVITDSQFSRSEICRVLQADCDPEVIYPGIDEQFRPIKDPGKILTVKTRNHINREYVLYAGIYKPRKNHQALLRAFGALLNRGANAELVIAGPLGNGETELRRAAAELGVADRVIFTGFVSDADLTALYSGARVYACPSLYEGFGFTILEAMACGVPVICSGESSLPEIAGEAALFADARDTEKFGAALYRVFTDDRLRVELRLKADKNLQRFSWGRTALQTLAVYQKALSPGVMRSAEKRSGIWAG